jgi:hypothetical protein
MSKITLALLALPYLSQSAIAAETDCAAKAAEKKLSAAAQTSFIKKCEKDASASAAELASEAKVAENKIFGAAKNSFTKKCIADAGK